MIPPQGRCDLRSQYNDVAIAQHNRCTLGSRGLLWTSKMWLQCDYSLDTIAKLCEISNLATKIPSSKINFTAIWLELTTSRRPSAEVDQRYKLSLSIWRSRGEQQWWRHARMRKGGRNQFQVVDMRLEELVARGTWTVWKACHNWSKMVMQRMINGIATNRARFGHVLLSAEPVLAGLVKSNAQLLG